MLSLLLGLLLFLYIYPKKGAHMKIASLLFAVCAIPTLSFAQTFIPMIEAPKFEEPKIESPSTATSLPSQKGFVESKAVNEAPISESKLREPSCGNHCTWMSIEEFSRQEKK
jgi:hypothetical protein